MTTEISTLTETAALADHSGFVRVEREIQAPPAMVFDAWTDPDQLTRWHAPRGCSIVFTGLDARPGGGFRSHLVTPDGHKCFVIGTYLEVDRPNRLVYRMEMADEHWQPAEPADLGMDQDWPRQTVVTVTFAEKDGGTLLTLQQTVAETLARQTGALPSWLVMLDQLAQQLGNVA